MLRAHQAYLAQATPDLSVEASEPQKAAAQPVSVLRSTAPMQLIQNQSYMSYSLEAKHHPTFELRRRYIIFYFGSRYNIFDRVAVNVWVSLKIAKGGH